MHVGTTLFGEFLGTSDGNLKAVIFGLGRLNVTYEFIVGKLKLYKRLYLKSGFFT